MTRIIGLTLAISLTLAATACGGNSKKDAAENAPTSPPTTTHSSAASLPDEAKVVYHDAVAGNDITVKAFRGIVAQMPKSMTCDELLAGGKALGNTYPNGEDLYLQVCKQVPRK